MSTGFQAVQWNRSKIIYDAIIVAAVALYIAGFMILGALTDPPKDMSGWIDLRIRAFGSCAFIMLTIILSIGPLARLNPRFLALLYNRRHLGVATFLVALTHGLSVVDWFWDQHALGGLIGEVTDPANYRKFIGITIKPLGFFALTILGLMASTSHDFWLAFLGPRAWKALHMLIYVAYGVLVMHVSLGVMQDDYTLFTPALLGGSFLTVAGLHIVAGWREWALDSGRHMSDGWIDVGPPDSIPEQRAKIVAGKGKERIAVFRDGRRVAAVSNVCAHQNGPIGEGRIIDGCITCPWHHYQYRFEDGCAPPPFTERLATYPLRMIGGILQVNNRPNPIGTPAAIEIAPIDVSRMAKT